MPRRLHPSKSVTPEHPSSSQVSMKKRDTNANRQGSTVYEMQARDGGVPIGSGGELRAFGKSATSYTKEPKDSTALQSMKNWAMSSSLLFKDSVNMENNALLGGDRGLLTRAVGSYQVDSYLGLNTLAEEKHGVDKNGKPIGISVQVDGAPVSRIKDDKSNLLDIDYSDPKIQRGLWDLEASDYITGQIDRHLGNVFVDATTGQVKGIDNDLCLPERPRAEMMQDIMVSIKTIGTMPKMMHEETARKIREANPDELRARLRASHVPGTQPLSEDAIEGAVTRLKEMQTELAKGKDSAIEVVSQFDKNTYQKALDAQEEEFMKVSKGKSYADVKKEYDEGGEAVMTNFTRSNKTSILGKIAQEQIASRIDTRNAVLHQESVKAERRDPQALAEGRAYQTMPREQQKAFDKEFAKLSEKEKQLEKRTAHLQHLAKPNILDKIASIAEGGVKGARKHDQKAIDKLRNEIAELNESLDNRLSGHMPKVGQTQTVEQGAPPLAQSQSSANQNAVELGESQSQSKLEKHDSVRNLLKEQGAVKLAKEKLGIVGNQAGKGMDTAGINKGSKMKK